MVPLLGAKGKKKAAFVEGRNIFRCEQEQAGSTKSGIQVVSTPYCTCYHRGNSGTGSTVTTKFALPLLRNFRETKHFGLLFFLFISFFFFFHFIRFISFHYLLFNS